MTRRLTDGQRAARRELCALARTALDVCDVAAAKGVEADDRPRRYLNGLVWWSRGEMTGPQLAALTRAMEEWRDAVVAALPTGDPWDDALHWIADAREDMAKHPTHMHHVERVCVHLATALRALTGDAGDAARAQVDDWRRRHRVAVAAEETERERAALAAKMKGDKAAAELVLGTAQEMGR